MMTHKGKTMNSYVIYNKMRRIKDRNKIRNMAKERDQDQKTKTALIKKS